MRFSTLSEDHARKGDNAADVDEDRQYQVHNGPTQTPISTTRTLVLWDESRDRRGADGVRHLPVANRIHNAVRPVVEAMTLVQRRNNVVCSVAEAMALIQRRSNVVRPVGELCEKWYRGTPVTTIMHY